MRRRGRASRRGATLIEAVVALGALGVGTAGVMTLMTYVSQTSERAAFHGRAIDVASEFAAQVADTTCDLLPDDNAPSPPATDPGLLAAGDQLAPVTGSAITLVGDIDGTPSVRVSYVSTLEIRGAGFDGPPAFDLEVRIREITNDDALDDPAITEGWWIRTFPVKKVCNRRTEPTGRGEFY